MKKRRNIVFRILGIDHLYIGFTKWDVEFHKEYNAGYWNYILYLGFVYISWGRWNI